MKTELKCFRVAKIGAELISGILALIRKVTLEYGESGRCRNRNAKKGMQP